MNPNEIDLTGASLVYAVSNTPLFLVRKLQADPAVHTIKDGCTGEETVQALRSVLSIEPSDAQAAVRPYAYLVALWYKPELEHLLEAARTSAPHHPWFKYIASVLIGTFSPIQKQFITVPGQLGSPGVSITSPSQTTAKIISIPSGS